MLFGIRILVVISLFFLVSNVVYAQESNQTGQDLKIIISESISASDGRTAILKTEENKQLEFLQNQVNELQESNTKLGILAAASVIGGTLLGYYMSERSRTRQEKEEIRKVKELLADDFERINKLTIDDIKKIITELEEFEKSGKKIDEFIQDRVSLAAYLGHLRKTYEFTFWDLIQVSGSLIKLSSEEIRGINIIHDALVNVDKLTRKSFEDFFGTVSKISLNEKDVENRKEDLRLSIVSYLTDSIRRIDTAYTSMLRLNLTWINISELSEADSKKLNEILEKRDEQLRRI